MFMIEKKIGETIRECRLRKGFTQESLAAAIHVSPQAISKWETGQTMPDITLLLPLSRELGIGVNQLLGGNRRQELEERFQKEVPFGHEFTLLVALDALKEFPDDETFLYRRAYDEYVIGQGAIQKSLRELYLNRAVGHFRELCRKFPEDSAYHSFLAKALLALGLTEQARSAALPCRGEEKEWMLELFRDEESKIAQQQTDIERHTIQLYTSLRKYGTREALAAAHTVLDAVFGEEQDLHTSMRWALLVQEAALCRDEGDTEGFIAYLTQAYEAACAQDALPRAVIPYRAPLCDRLQNDRSHGSEVTSEVFQFIFCHHMLLAHPAAEALRRRIVDEKLFCRPLHPHEWKAYFQFCQRHINTETFFNFSIGWNQTQEELDAMGNTLSKNPRYPGNSSIELMEINRNEVKQLVSSGIMQGYVARFESEILAYCNCGDKEGYIDLGLPEEERAIPTAPAGAKILAIVEILVANSFKNSGLEEKLLDCALTDAKKKGYTHAEVYPLKRLLLNQKEFPMLVERYQRAGFRIVRDLTTDWNGEQYLMQKEL